MLSVKIFSPGYDRFSRWSAHTRRRGRLMAKAPDIGRQSLRLVRRKLRPTHWWHRAAILLRVWHTFRYRLQNSGEAAIAPQPFLAAEVRPQRRTTTIRA